LTHLGFTVRVRGSHYIFTRPGVSEIINRASKSGESEVLSGQASGRDHPSLQSMKIPHYSVQIVWSGEDLAYLATVPELPGCRADGATPEEALANVRLIAAEWVETARDAKREIPKPLTFEHLEKQRIELQKEIRGQVGELVEGALKIVIPQILQQIVPQGIGHTLKKPKGVSSRKRERGVLREGLLPLRKG
jgi:predicted RNase H-like HicB family nuclease